MKQLMNDIRQGDYKEGFSRFWRRKHLPLVGYLLLTFFVALSFYLSGQQRQNQRHDLAIAFSLQCKRVNELSNNQAADIYQNWVDLEKNARLLGISLTPELRKEVLADSNKHLLRLKYYDCSVSPFKEQVWVTYQPIISDRPIPKIPPKFTSHLG